MILKALEIQGFKSFPDKTRIAVERGITGVVGPNGSGKSNISDAIRWVMGETSAKQLRGGGKMENVIFSGSAQRGPMGFAAVSLVIDNSDRGIDIDADEVVVGRRYYRSGESEYTVNGQNVRLKDIYEMFLDTGLGRDGYSVIGQGRIAEIVGAKSAERREIFEEASGIAKYRYRKNEAERRLSSAEENLVRLRDILAELEGRVGPLEKESEKAKKYLELAERRKGLEVTLWTDTVRRAKEAVREAQRKIEIANADYAGVSRRIEAAEAATADIRAGIEALIAHIDEKNAGIRTLEQAAAGADARIAVLENDIRHNEATADTLRGELRAGSEGAKALEEERAAHEAQRAALGAEIEAAAQRIARLEASLAELTEKSAATGERRGQLEAQLTALAARATDLKVEAAAAQAAAQSAAARLAAQAGEEAAAQQAIAGLEEQKRETDAFLADAAAAVTRLENVRAGLSLKLESRKRLLDEAQAAQQACARAEEAAQRGRLLRELEHSMDGFQGSVKSVMKAAEARRLRGITGPVSTILTVQPGYETAIETALGFALQNIVVEDETAAKAAMAYLKETKGGRATFLPLDTVRPAGFDARSLPQEAVCASSLVQAEARYANIVSNLLGRIVVVDDINTASRVARALGYRNRVVTRDGQVINAGGSFTGGSVSRSAGLFSRKQELEELRKRLAGLEEERAGAAKRTQAAAAEVTQLEAQLTAAESELITAGGDKIRGEVETKRVDAALAAARESLAALQRGREELEQTQARQAAAGAEAQADMQRAEEQAHILEAELAGVSGTDGDFLAARTRLADELSECKLHKLGLEKDAEAHAASLEALRDRTGEKDERARQIEASLRALEQQNEQHCAAIEAVRAQTQQSREAIAACEEEIRALAQQRLEKEGATAQNTALVRRLTDEREALGREAARLAEQKEQKDAEYDATAAKLWEEYELTLSDAEALCVPFESAAQLRRDVGEVRARIRALGNVNVGAIDEYAEVRARYDYMRAQVADVEQSKAELEKMIASLAAEMRSMFTQSFEAINRNFGRIFAELFGGGSASLKLEDEADVLESGIEIEVAPPGKIIKNLSALSGGEQALVAISIYFAILAVNPAPFCVLDEIEAALDDVNVTRFAQYLRRICGSTQFIVITHRRGTMEEADVLYGVTMQEDGVSKLLRLDVNHVDASLVN
ncbi:MAG: chromosome segregation protein SMC [Ruthenibacterium sp.]